MNASLVLQRTAVGAPWVCRRIRNSDRNSWVLGFVDDFATPCIARVQASSQLPCGYECLTCGAEDGSRRAVGLWQNQKLRSKFLGGPVI